MEERKSPSLWVEGSGENLKITHIKCGTEVEIRKIPYPGEDDPRVFHVLDCKNNCLASGGLYFFGDALEKFKADLEELKSGEQIFVRRGPTLEGPKRSYMISSQILDVFEKR